MRRFVLTVVAGLSTFALAAPASAALVAVGTGCQTSLPDPNAIDCSGAWAGNLNNNASIGDLNAALDDLVGGNFTPDVVWSTLDPTKLFFSAGTGTTLNFASTLFGEQILSLHFGNAGSGLGNHTILYMFDFGAGGANSIVLNQQGWSNAVLITPPGSTPPVPEPATWAMMLLGFVGAGIAIRRSRRRDRELLQVA